MITAGFPSLQTLVILRLSEPPAIRGAAQPVVVATRAKELLAIGQAKADMLGLVVARVLGRVTVHRGDMVAVQVMGSVESLQAGADPGNDRVRPASRSPEPLYSQQASSVNSAPSLSQSLVSRAVAYAMTASTIAARSASS